MLDLKKLGLIGTGALGSAVLVIGVTGIAGAQDDEPTLEDPAPAEESTDEDGGTRGERHAERRQAMVDQLVEDGTITQEQADDLQAVREAIQTQREEQRAEKLAGVAEVLDMTVEDLQAAKSDGQSLADIAGDNLPALVDYLTGEATDRINSAVEDGRITQEQADEKLDGLSDRIEERIENGGGFGRGHGRGGHHRGGFGNFDPSAEVPQQLLDRLADSGVDTSDITTLEDLRTLRESGDLGNIEFGRGFGRGGFGGGANGAAETVASLT